MKKPRRKRDPDGAHRRILAAALEMLAKDGEEALTLRQVVMRADVNRSAAYQHFQTREKLIEATAAWVSDRLCIAVFGDPENPQARAPLTAEAVSRGFAHFAMDNLALGRVWLFHLLNSPKPGSDRFFRMYLSYLRKFAQSEYAQPGIDVEVHAVVMLVGTFLWPVWACARTSDATQRKQMADRFVREMLRFSLQGAYRPRDQRRITSTSHRDKGYAQNRVE